MSRFDPPEPCMCGADDCRLCHPNSWRESEYDENRDDEEDRRDHELDAARDEDDIDGGYELGDPKHSGYIDRALALIDQAKEARRG